MCITAFAILRQITTLSGLAKSSIADPLLNSGFETILTLFFRPFWSSIIFLLVPTGTVTSQLIPDYQPRYLIMNYRHRTKRWISCVPSFEGVPTAKDASNSDG